MAIDVRTNYLVTATASIAKEVTALHELLTQIHELADGRDLKLKVTLDGDARKELNEIRQGLAGGSGGGGGGGGGTGTAQPSSGPPITKGDMRDLIRSVKELVTKIATQPSRGAAPAAGPNTASAGASEPVPSADPVTSTARQLLLRSQQKLADARKKQEEVVKAAQARQDKIGSLLDEIVEASSAGLDRTSSNTKIDPNTESDVRAALLKSERVLEKLTAKLANIDKALTNRAKALANLEGSLEATQTNAPRVTSARRRANPGGGAGGFALDFQALQGAIDHVANLLQTKLAAAINNLPQIPNAGSPNIAAGPRTPGSTGPQKVFTSEQVEKYLGKIGNVRAGQADKALKNIESGKYAYTPEAQAAGLMDRVIKALEARAGRAFAGTTAPTQGVASSVGAATTAAAETIATAGAGPKALTPEEIEWRKSKQGRRLRNKFVRRREQAEKALVGSELEQIRDLETQVREKSIAPPGEAPEARALREGDIARLQDRAQNIRLTQAKRREAISKGRVLFDLSRLSGEVVPEQPLEDLQKKRRLEGRYQELRAATEVPQEPAAIPSQYDTPEAQAKRKVRAARRPLQPQTVGAAGAFSRARIDVETPTESSPINQAERLKKRFDQLVDSGLSKDKAAEIARAELAGGVSSDAPGQDILRILRSRNLSRAGAYSAFSGRVGKTLSPRDKDAATRSVLEQIDRVSTQNPELGAALRALEQVEDPIGPQFGVKGGEIGPALPTKRELAALILKRFGSGRQGQVVGGEAGLAAGPGGELILAPVQGPQRPDPELDYGRGLIGPPQRSTKLSAEQLNSRYGFGAGQIGPPELKDLTSSPLGVPKKLSEAQLGGTGLSVLLGNILDRPQDKDRSKVLDLLKRGGLSTGAEKYLDQFIPEGAKAVDTPEITLLEKILTFREGYQKKRQVFFDAGQKKSIRNLEKRYQKELAAYVASLQTEDVRLEPETQNALVGAFGSLDSIRELTNRKAKNRGAAGQKRGEEYGVELNNFGKPLSEAGKIAGGGVVGELKGGESVFTADAFRLVRGLKDVREFLVGLEDVDLKYRNKGNAAQIDRLAELRQNYPELKKFLGRKGVGAESYGFRSGALTEIKDIQADARKELEYAQAQIKRPEFGDVELTDRPQGGKIAPAELTEIQTEVKKLLNLLGYVKKPGEPARLAGRLNKQEREAAQTRLEFLNRVAGADSGVPNEFAQRDYYRRDEQGNFVVRLDADGRPLKGTDFTPLAERAAAIQQYRGQKATEGLDPTEGISTIESLQALERLKTQRAQTRLPEASNPEVLDALYKDAVQQRLNYKDVIADTTLNKPVSDAQVAITEAKQAISNKDTKVGTPEYEAAKEKLRKAEEELAAAMRIRTQKVREANERADAAVATYREEGVRQLGPLAGEGSLRDPKRLIPIGAERAARGLGESEQGANLELDKSIKFYENQLRVNQGRDSAALEAAKAAAAANEKAAAAGTGGGDGGGTPPGSPPGTGGGSDGSDPDIPLDKRLGSIKDKLTALRDLNLSALVSYFEKMAEYTSLMAANLRSVQGVIDPVTKKLAQEAVQDTRKKRREEAGKSDGVAIANARRQEYNGLIQQFGGNNISSDGLLRQINSVLSRLNRQDQTVRSSLERAALNQASDLPDAPYRQRAANAALDRYSTGNELAALSSLAANSNDPQLRGFAQAGPTLNALKEATDRRKSAEQGIDDIATLLKGGEQARESLRNAIFANENARKAAVENPNEGTGLPNTKEQRDAINQRYGAKAQQLKKELAAYGPSDDALIKQQNALQDKRTIALKDEQKIVGVLRQQASGAAELGKHIGDSNNWAEKLFSTFRRLGDYLIASYVLYNLVDALRQSVTEAIKLEATVTRIQGVLGESGSVSYNRIRGDILDAAQTYGSSPAEAASGFQTFSQAGFRGEGLTQVVRASLAAEAGAGLQPQQAQELLIAVNALTDSTSILNARAITFGDIVDRISNIEKTYAVSAQDLAIAVQRVGSLAQQLQPNALGGVDFADLVIGATTQIVEKTRVTGNQAASSLRFILARLTAPDTSKQLNNKFGVALFSDEGGKQLRPVLDILSDIAVKYQDLVKNNETFKAQQLLQVVGGARQINAVTALLSDFGNVLKIAGDSSLSFGQTQARLALQMNTLDRQMGRFGASFQEFISNLLTGGQVLGGPGAKVVGGAADLVSAAAKDPGTTLAIGGLIGQILLQVLKKKPKLGPTLLGVGGAAIEGAEATVGPIGQMFKSIGKLIGTIFSLGGVGRLALLARVFTGLGAGLLVLKGIFALIDKYSDKLAPSEIDYTPVKTSDEYLQFQQRSELVGGDRLKNGVPLSKAVLDAAGRAQDVVGKRLGLGSDYFSAPDANTKIKTDTRLRKALEDEFVKQLVDAGVQLGKFGGAAEQLLGAFDLLKDAIKITRFEPSFRAGEFKTRATETLDAAQKKAQEFLRKSDLQKPLEELDLVRERAYRSNVIDKAISGVSGGLLDEFTTGLTDAQGRVGSFSDLVAKRAQPGQSVGTAIDAAYLDTFIGQDSDNDKTRRRKESQNNRLIEFLRVKQERETGADRLLAAAGGQEGTAGSLAGVSQGELVYRQVFANALVAQERTLKRFAAAGYDVTKAVQLLERTRDAGNAPGYTRARVDNIAGAALRNRLVDILGGFAVQSAEINALGGEGADRGLFGRAGITYDRDRERQSAAETLARQYGRLKPETQLDLLRVRSQLPSDYKVQIARSEAQAALGAEDTGIERSLQAYDATRNVIAGLAPGFDEGTLKTLSERFNVLTGQLEILNSDQGLLDAFSPEDRSFLTDALATAAKIDPKDLAAKGAFTEVFGGKVIELALAQSRKVTFDRERRESRLLQSQEAQTKRQDRQLRSQEVFRGGRLRVAQSQGLIPGLREELSQVGESVQDALAKIQLDSTQKRAQLELKRAAGVSPAELRALEEDQAQARKNAEVAAIEDGEALRAELLKRTFSDLTAQQIEAQNQAALAGTAGVKDLLNVQSFFPQKEESRNFVGRIGQRLIGPAAATLSERTADNLQEALFGLEGLFGKQARDLFGQSDADKFAGKIEQAHALGGDTISQTLDRTFINGADVLGQAITAALESSPVGEAGPTAPGRGNKLPKGVDTASALALGLIPGVSTAFKSGRNPNNLATGQDISNQLANAAYANEAKNNKSAVPKTAKQLRNDRLKGGLLNLAGQFGGAAIGSALGRGKYSYAGEGATVGNAIGTVIGGPVGGFVGGLAGGLLGGLFGKAKPKKSPEYTQLERLERAARETTQAINNQTNQLLSVDNRVLNAPSNFNAPAYAPVAGGSGVANTTVQQSVQITIQDVRDPDATAKAVQRVLQQESRRQGGFTSSRY